MDIEKKELWERLDNEPERAYRAFECFLSLPGSRRTLVEAYRQHVGNPGAAKPSDTWVRWSHDYAWSERAAAYDDHLANVRRKAHERVIEQEAERQASAAEKDFFKLQEITAVAYDRVFNWLDSEEWDDSRLRFSDVLNFIKIYMEQTYREMELEQAAQTQDFEISEEDDAALSDIVDFMESYRAQGGSGDDDALPEGRYLRKIRERAKKTPKTMRMITIRP